MHEKLPLGLLGALAIAGALSIGCGPSDSAASTSTSTGTGTGTGTSSGTGGEGGTGGAGGTGGTGGSGGSGGAGGASVWGLPACDAVSGTSAVTFTKDEGATLAPTPGQLSGVGYTMGLAALDTPNTLLAEHKGALLRSEDAGCTWKEIATLTGGPFNLAAAKGGLAYAWADNNAGFYRIDATGAHSFSTPAGNIVGLGVDASDGKHLRVGDASGMIHESKDGGESWTKQGGITATGIGYRYAFDPANLDHVLFGQSGDGAAVSFDGGATFKKSVGLESGKNAFSLVVSPVDGKYVWAEALDMGPSVRYIYRSEDGGATFASVVQDSPDTKLTNGTLLVPHASDPNVLYFEFGTYYGGYGTDLLRYDHASGMVTKTHNAYNDVSAIVASPADAGLLYLGLTIETIL